VDVPDFRELRQRSRSAAPAAAQRAGLTMQDEANPGQDREARILARRKRIEEQLGAKAGDGGEQGRRKKEEAAAEESRSKVQISDTRGKIDKIKTAGHAEVTTIRIVGDSRENERRINEEVNRQGRRQKLLYEAESSARQNAAVAMKWSALFEREIPQDLMQDIEQQKDTCERIIQSKDRLIKEFKAELKAKDDEYVKSLKKQAEDVDLLLDKMGQQYRSLRGAFEVELEDVETAFMQERHELMQANLGELGALMEKRREKEELYMESRRRRVEEDQKQLEAQRVQDNEDYSILKIKLETEIQTLEQQLEEMRAT
jgi:dynein regulatory complex protein 1